MGVSDEQFGGGTDASTGGVPGATRPVSDSSGAAGGVIDVEGVAGIIRISGRVALSHERNSPNEAIPNDALAGDFAEGAE